MHIFDPVDCRQARDMIAQQQHAPAATLLLNSPHRAHRSAQQLLAELLPNLVNEAKVLREQSALPAAKERIDLAAQCGVLKADQQQLFDLISAEFSRQQQQLNQQQQRLQQAQRWAAEGRVVSALGLVQPVEGTAADLARRDWDEQHQRFERYLNEAETYIEQQAFAAACDRLDRARAIQTVHPRLVLVEARYRAAVGLKSPASNSSPLGERQNGSSGDVGGALLPDSSILTNATGSSAHPTGNSQRSDAAACLPSRLCLEDTLIATGHELVIGNPRGKGVTVPLLANIHSRHAVVVRHRHGHQLLAMPGCETRRNGELVNGACELQPDDVLQFGAADCEWCYRRPIQGSLTAVFEPVGSMSAESIRLPDGSSCRRVVWWDELLVIAARPATAAHVIVRDLPVLELRLHRDVSGFRIASTSAELFVERGSVEVPVKQEVVPCPCRLIVRVEMSEADILRQQFASRGRESVSDHCVLDFRRLAAIS